MNDYPRKLFNGKSANEMYLSEFTNIFHNVTFIVAIYEVLIISII